MNKVQFIILLSIILISCNKKDDNTEEETQQICETCLFETIGPNETSNYCDNGDGTVTITNNSSGEVNTVSLAGSSFEDYINNIEQNGGAVCKEELN